MFSRTSGVETSGVTHTALRDAPALKGDFFSQEDFAGAEPRPFQAVSDKLERTAHRTQAAMRSAVGDLDLRADDVRRMVVRNPLLAVGAAMAAGVILGRLIARRSA